MAKIVIVAGIWYDTGFRFLDLDWIIIFAILSDPDCIQILLKFFVPEQMIKFQSPHNTGM